MDILKISTEWARAELFSSKIVGLLSLIVLLTAVGFALWGKTTMARAFIIPMIVAGLFLLAVGIGLYTANKPRIEQFKTEYNTDANSFVQKEIARTTKSQGEFHTVFKVLPAIIIVAVILLMLFPSANWRAITLTVIITSAFLMLIDSNTEARNTNYREQLLKFKKV